MGIGFANVLTVRSPSSHAQLKGSFHSSRSSNALWIYQLSTHQPIALPPRRLIRQTVDGHIHYPIIHHPNASLRRKRPASVLLEENECPDEHQREDSYRKDCGDHL